MKTPSRNVTIRALYAALLAVLVSQPGCNPFRGLPNAEPCTPHSDKDILASMAITRAVMNPGDIPDVKLLDRSSAIVLATATSYITLQGDTVDNFLTVCSLPRKWSMRFTLLTPEQIQALADDHGNYVYLSISAIQETSDGALVTINTTWAVAKNSPVAIMSGGGYMLHFRKDGYKWSFDKVVSNWIH